MLNVFLTLAAIAAVGASLHYLLPQLDIDSTRRQAGILVLNVLLPALNIEVIYRSSVGRQLWQIPLAMLIGALVCVSVALLIFRRFPIEQKLKSSLILGSAFGNVTYLGMPLLQGLFPAQLLQVTEIAILCEITVTSSDLITGSLLDMFHHQGPHTSLITALLQILKFPLLWSAALAIAMRLSGIQLPGFLLMALHLLGQSASGLMLLVLGMALKPKAVAGSLADIKSWWPMLMIKLGLMPVVVGVAGLMVGLTALNLHATTLEGAMPPQLFTLIVADRFGFDTEVLAAAVTCMTVISLLTLPIVHRLLF
jgi:malate permease and related proteins